MGYGVFHGFVFFGIKKAPKGAFIENLVLFLVNFHI